MAYQCTCKSPPPIFGLHAPIAHGRLIKTPCIATHNEIALGFSAVKGLKKVSSYLHNHLEALRPLRQQVRVGRHGGHERPLALDVRGQVSHMTKEPVDELRVPVTEGSEERSDAPLVSGLGVRSEGREGRE